MAESSITAESGAPAAAQSCLSPLAAAEQAGTQNLYSRIAEIARKFPDRVAFTVQHREELESVRYVELLARAESAACSLAARGIASGEKCAILADNGIAWCVGYLGILRLAGIAVPFDTHYNAPQVAILLKDSGAKIILTSRRYLAVAEEALQIAALSAEIILLSGDSPGKRSLDEIPPAGAAGANSCTAIRLDPAVILYTSGTTSDPKGVVLTHGNLLAEAEAAFQLISVNEKDVVLGVLPLFHALAQVANLLLPLLVGASVIFLEELNTAELARALRERQPTVFCCVPKFFYLIHERVFGEAAKMGFPRSMIFRMLLRISGFLRRFAGMNPGPFFFRRVHSVFGGRIRFLVTAGARFEPAIGRDYYRLGFPLMEGYGLTESSGAATCTRPGEGGLGTVGAALPGVELKIFPAPEIGETDSRTGEIAIRGPIVMQGYFNRPDATAQTMKDGWLMTGDLGRIDARGQLTITGRKKEVIVLSSGKNIYPEEVEAHYAQSPLIRELCVVGMPAAGDAAVDRLYAVIVPNQETMRARKIVNMREVIRFEIENLSVDLSSYKRILGFELCMEDLPRTTTSKLKRFEIERRLRTRERGEARGEAGRLESAEDAAWAANPSVARALELVRDAAHEKNLVSPGANLELDLGLDSIERVELLTNLQMLFGTRVSEETAQDLLTVRQLVEAVLPRESVAVSPAATPDAWHELLTHLPEADPLLKDLVTPHPIFLVAMFAVLKIARVLARGLLGFRVSGIDRLTREGPYLLCPNHQSFLDPFLLVCALPFRTVRQLFFIGASEYFATPFRKAAARWLHIAPVDPDTNLVRAMQASAYGLRHGKILVLFPEGEREIDGELKTFKKGAAILSAHLKVPVVPVSLEGIFEVWPRNRTFRWRALLPWEPTRVRLKFGQLVAPLALPSNAPASQMDSAYREFAALLKSRIAKMQEPRT
ncbi:MAG: AMP-binding protein [Candidatus Acidiferrales bacterium]